MLVALAVLAGSEMADLAFVAGTHGVPALSAMIVALTVAGLVLTWLRRRRTLPLSSVLWFGAAFLAARAVSLAAAADAGAAGSELTQLAEDLVFLAVVLTVCVWARGEWLLARVVVGTAALLASLTLVQQFVLHNSTTFAGLAQLPRHVDVGLAVARHAGPFPDVNFWGRVLVVTAPLALSLFADRDQGRRRWWWLASFAAICGGIYLSGSRGALLSLAIVTVGWCLLAGRRYTRLLVFAPLLGVLLLSVPGVGSRLASLGDLSTTATSREDPSLVGRMDIQTIALHMFADHPATGVGAGNFEVAEADYQRSLGVGGEILAAHNLYLEMAAESGVLGLAGWLGFYGSALFVAARARALCPRGHAHWLLSGGVIAALIGWGIASLPLHVATLRVFLLVAALGAALDIRARSAVAARTGESRWRPDMIISAIERRPARSRVRPAVVGATILTAVVGLGLLIPGLVLTERWSATAVVRLVPAGGTGAWAHELTVMSRRPVTDTYLTVLGNERFRRMAAASLGTPAGRRSGSTVRVRHPRSSPEFVITASSADAAVAREMADGTRVFAMSHLNGLRPLYRLQAVREADEPPKATTAVRWPALAGVIAAGLAAAGLVLTGGQAARRRGARRRSAAATGEDRGQRAQHDFEVRPQ